MFYLHTKFDHYSFSRSRDMVADCQNLNGSPSRDLTTPLSGTICYPWALDTINLPTKCELPISVHYEYMKGNTKYRN